MNTQTLLLTADAVATARGIIAKCQIPVTLDVPAGTNVVKGYVYDTVEGAHGRFEQVLAGYTSHEVYTCTLHIPAVEALDAWQVIAKREPAPDGSPFVEWYIDANETAGILESLPASGVCQACGLARTRNKTYILRKQGVLLQVGGSCIAKYVPAHLQRALESLYVTLCKVRDLGGDPDGFDLGGGGDRSNFVRLADAVGIACKLHRAGVPYIRSKDEWGEPNPSATWRQVIKVLDRTNLDTVHTNVKEAIWGEPADEALVADVLEALRADTSERRIAGLEFEYAKKRVLALLIPAVNRLLADRAKADKPQVEPVLPPDGRLTVDGLVLSIKEVETQFGWATKLLIDCGGFRLYGTQPSGLDAVVGGTVRFVATVQPKEVGFGFYSRPTVKGVK